MLWATWGWWFCCSSVAKSCWTLFDPVDCSPPGFSVHGMSQARTLAWAATPSSSGASRPGIEPAPPALAGGFFTTDPPGKPCGKHGRRTFPSSRKVLLDSAIFKVTNIFKTNSQKQKTNLIKKYGFPLSLENSYLETLGWIPRWSWREGTAPPPSPVPWRPASAAVSQQRFATRSGPGFYSSL